MVKPRVSGHPHVQILEAGNIAFFYRPKEGILHPKSPDDLERAYFILFPDDQQHHQNRLFNVAHGVFPAIVPGKALPEERDWAFIDDVSHDPRDVVDALEKNVPGPPGPGGQRARPWARIAGDGRYAIARHVDHTHLVYVLHQPERPGEVQQKLEIQPEASYIISVKQPYAPSEINLKEKPSYPASLIKKFDGHGFIPVEPTDYLDYRWTQVLLIGARTDVEKELGIKLDAAQENRAEEEALQFLHQEAQEAHTKWHVDIFAPMCQGKWE
ncbi:MAG TPA: hypothetical protein VKX96_08275 [Chloroflexota bacterium]|nr:hypothetical protein [Chloroflexota bacterium]